jgi:hypothetical protein
VTGLSAENQFLYLGSRAQNRCYRYYLPGITGRYNYSYFTGFSNSRDLVKTPDNLIWVASDNASMPLACYDTGNTRVDYILNDLVPYARGVAMDPDGYLWVSDIVNDVIYKIDLSEGVEGEGSTLSLTPSANPFMGSVSIQGTGFGQNATVSIFDLNGRMVDSGQFDGDYTWNAATGNGVYFVVVRDELGNYETLELVKL